MMSTTSTSTTTSTAVPGASLVVAEDILVYGGGDGNTKFIQPTLNDNSNANNSTSNSYLTNASNNNHQVEISTSTSNQSQTLKHFLAQKYAAESTSDGDTESHSNNNNLPNQSNFSQTISNFYPFSPLVSSSSNSHFDSRGILADGVLESSIDSLQVESSTNNTTTNANHEQVSGHSSNHLSFSTDNLTPSIDQTFIKHEQDCGPAIGLSPASATTPTNVTSSSTNGRTVVTANGTNQIHLVPSNLFDTVNSDITVDSTTINISQQQQSPGSNHLTFNNYPSPLNNHHQHTSVLSYGLSPSTFSNTFLQIDNGQQNLLPSLASPTIQSIDQYFNQQHTTVNGLDKKHEHATNLLDQHHLLQTYTTNENHCLISDNSLSDNLFHDIHSNPENFNENEINNLHETIINDLPVLTRARASLPIDYLYLPEDNSLGIYARKHIPKRTLFGPVEGTADSLPDNQYLPNSLAYNSKNNFIIFITDTMILNQTDENNSNWTRFVRPAVNLNEQNLELITKEFANETKFYFISTRNIEPNEELKVWYSSTYAQRLNIKLLEPSQANEIQNLLQEENLIKKEPPQSQTFAIESLATVNNDDNVNNNVTPGHKLRNKIAKTQQIIVTNSANNDATNNNNQNNSGTTTQIHAIKSLPNKLPVHHHQQTQIQDLCFANNTDLTHLVSTLNGSNLIIQQTPNITTLNLDKTNSFKVNNNADQTKIATTSIATVASNNNNEKPKYQCDKCQKVFPRHYSLRRHLVMHSGEKRYKCPICGQAFNHVYNRNRHIKMHKNVQLQTQIQQATTDNNNDANSSIATTTIVASNDHNQENNNDIKMESVERTVLLLNADNQTTTHSDNQVQDSDLQRQNPMLNELIDSSNNTCQIDTNQSSTSSLDESSGSPLSQKDINSDSSSKKSDMVSSSGLDNKCKNSNNNQSTSDKMYRCSRCYKRFSTEERLKKHGIVHDESAKKLSCDVCDRKFLTNSALTCHIKYHQLSDEKRKYDCPLCDKVFETIQMRRKHVSVHINPNTGLFHCPKCSKTSEDFSIIRKHLKSFHSNEIFQCTECPKVFPRQDKLRLHMLCHIDRWEFKCNICDKQFKRKDKLKEHTQRMHAPDRDAKIAAKIAARMQRIKVQRTKKVVTKPSQPNYHEYVYKCHLCLFGFKRRGMLVNHLAKRHPEVPYNTVPELNMPIVKTSKDYYCQYCDKIYKSSSKRKAHIIKNHPGKSLPPSNRSKSSIQSDMMSQSFSQTVGSITINPHFCDWCHKQYASKAKLMQHQRKKHQDKLLQRQQQNPTSSTKPKQVRQRGKSNNNVVQQSVVVAASQNISPPKTSTTIVTNGGSSAAVAMPSMYKLNTIVTGDKATFTTIPITPEQMSSIKEETPTSSSCTQIFPLDTSKMDQFLTDDSSGNYLDGFTMTNATNHFTKDNNGSNGFLNGTGGQTTPVPVDIQTPPTTQVHYVIDSNDPVFEDIMNINIDHDLNSVNNNPNNVITILACTNPSTGATMFHSDLSEFSDIITQISSDFQNVPNTKQIQLTNANHTTTLNGSVNSASSSAVHGHSETNHHTDLMISGTMVVEDNNWNQVCEEMAMV